MPGPSVRWLQVATGLALLVWGAGVPMDPLNLGAVALGSFLLMRRGEK